MTDAERIERLEAALRLAAARFAEYVEMHSEKLWDGSISEAQRNTVRAKVDRNLRYASEARQALGDTNDQ